MPAKLVITLLIFLVLPALAASVDTNEVPHTLKAYQAKYLAYYKGDEVGYATREFRFIAPSLCQVKMQTYASKLFYSDERNERSEFECQQLDNNQWQIRPQSYQYIVEKTFGDEAAKQTFDWQKMTVKGKNEDGKWNIAIEAGTQDKISVYWRLMRDLSADKKSYTYKVTDDGKTKDYEFLLEGQESIQLPYGKLDTFKVSRTRSNGKRKTIYWFASSLANAPVRIQHFKYDELQGDLLLKEFSWLE